MNRVQNLVDTLAMHLDQLFLSGAYTTDEVIDALRILADHWEQDDDGGNEEVLLG